MGNTILVTAAIIAAAGAAYIIARNRRMPKVYTLDNIKEETIEGTITLDDIVGLFKQQSLNPKEDTPFIAKGDLRKFFSNVKIDKEGYKTILVGTYRNKKEECNPLILIHAKDFDDKIVEVFGNENLVVLS